MEPNVVIKCEECGFRREFGPDDDGLPADVVVSHGQETGHRLTVDEAET